MTRPIPAHKSWPVFARRIFHKLVWMQSLGKERILVQVVLIVIDSGGIGEAPDARSYGDEGANTIGHALERAGNPHLPHLSAMGLEWLLGDPTPKGSWKSPECLGAATKLSPRAQGKDTLAGHWEMMGLVVDHPFQTYPEGFPAMVVKALTDAFGLPILGNRPASGTAIIEELGALHMKTGQPIVYTSADSVLQIAAHESVVPLDRLYQWCLAARAIMQGPHLVGRIIARPFIGEPGAFVRTAHRHDYAVAPWSETMVDRLQNAGVETVAIGKIGDIFSRQGFDTTVSTKSNRDGLKRTVEVAGAGGGDRFVFVNLVEFDSHYGHRRDPLGYVMGLQELDAFLPDIWGVLDPQDQLWITADHGCDPTFPGSDHTREWVPWLTYGSRIEPQIGEDRHTLADIGATLGALFQVTTVGPGRPWRALVRG